MNLFTQSLLKELLGEQKTVAIYGGGFKPPTKGHFTVAQKALKELPDIDELKIFVGGGVRDGITQNESVQIWKIYQPYLSNKIEVEPVSSPVKAVLDYAKENPDEKVYWILGAREGDEDDLKDIENRTKSLDKYPNIEVKIITTAGGVSGTKTRASISSGNKEDFFNLIPNIQEKEEIWNILSPIVKEGIVDNMKNYILAVDKVEDLQEGRKKKPEPEKGTGKKPEGSSRRLYTDEDPKDTVGISFKTKEDIVDTLNKKSFKAKSHARQSQIINVIHQRVRAAYNRAKDPETKARLKRGLDYIEKRREMSKKKTERLNKMKEASDPQAGTALPYGSGFAPIKESYQFKVSDKNYDEEDNSLISVDYNFSTPDNDYRVEFNSGEYNPESKKFDVSFGLDKGYGFKLDTFQMTGEGNALSILKTIVNIIKDFTNRFEVNKLVINPTSKKRGKIYSMVLKLLPSDILNKVELINENQVATAAESFYLNIPKFNQPKTVQQYLIESINEISLSKENAAKINGDLTGGTFTVGDITYEYSIKNIPNPYKDLGLFYNIQFTPSGEVTSIPKGGKENYIKILSTMYKIILDFIEKEQPTYVGISSLDNSGDKNYHTVYNRLTSNHMGFIPGYFRKDSNLTFDSPQGKGRFIVLKKKDNLDEKKSKDSFGLNAYARELVKETFKEDWNLKEGMLSLSRYMIDNGMNIKPLPKIKVIDNDAENASNLLGKTAYYNPVEKSITLFTMNRHPKDVLRSFAHEMVHHMQNLEGRLNNISTQNTNEDGDLPEIEREAYEKGNMMLRNWEDNIKNV